MDFTKAVKAAMEKTGMKKTDVARGAGYSYQHINDLLSGDRRWNEDSMNKVCKVLGIQVDFKILVPCDGGANSEQTYSQP